MKILVDYQGYQLIEKYNAFYIRLFLGEIVPILCEFKIDKEEGEQILKDNGLIVDIVQRYSREKEWTLSKFAENSILDYLKSTGLNEKRALDSLTSLKKHEDIMMEFYDYIILEGFQGKRKIQVCNYTAQQLFENYELSVLGAFNYLIYLREEPEEALADLKKGLPRRSLFYENELEKINNTVEGTNMSEENVTNVEETEATPEVTAEEERAACPNKEIADKLEAIQQALATLQEAFDDKIAEDAHKNGLFDNMHRELTKYQNGAMDKIVDTVALDIIQLVDTTKGHYRVYEKKEPTEENYKKLLRIMKGTVEDLQDILYRQSIEPYRVEGHAVDVRRQKIIQTLPTNDQSKDNLVAVRAADGYEKDGKVLRHERIKIFKYDPDADAEAK